MVSCREGVPTWGDFLPKDTGWRLGTSVVSGLGALPAFSGGVRGGCPPHSAQDGPPGNDLAPCQQCPGDPGLSSSLRSTWEPWRPSPPPAGVHVAPTGLGAYVVVRGSLPLRPPAWLETCIVSEPSRWCLGPPGKQGRPCWSPGMGVLGRRGQGQAPWAQVSRGTSLGFPRALASGGSCWHGDPAWWQDTGVGAGGPLAAQAGHEAWHWIWPAGTWGSLSPVSRGEVLLGAGRLAQIPVVPLMSRVSWWGQQPESLQ